MSASWKALADNHTCGGGLDWFMLRLSFFSIRTTLNWGVEWVFGTFTTICVKF